MKETLESNEFAIQDNAIFRPDPKTILVKKDGTFTISYKLVDAESNLQVGPASGPPIPIRETFLRCGVFRFANEILSGTSNDITLFIPEEDNPSIFLQSTNLDYDLKTSAVKGEHGGQ
ncbi:MAG: hypothetical protein QM737_02440 [Ferruginibacter sp.]